jgi:hypothetical protein
MGSHQPTAHTHHLPGPRRHPAALLERLDQAEGVLSAQQHPERAAARRLVKDGGTGGLETERQRPDRWGANQGVRGGMEQVWCVSNEACTQSSGNHYCVSHRMPTRPGVLAAHAGAAGGWWCQPSSTMWWTDNHWGTVVMFVVFVLSMVASLGRSDAATLTGPGVGQVHAALEMWLVCQAAMCTGCCGSWMCGMWCTHPRGWLVCALAGTQVVCLTAAAACHGCAGG